MRTFKIHLETPAELTEEQFQSLRGSDVHATMIINRVEVWVSSKSMARVTFMIEKAQNEVREWLRKNCKGAFFLSTANLLGSQIIKCHACTIYLLNPDNAPTLKLFLHEKDINLPEEEDGSRGPTGPVGIRGPTGPQGPVGIQEIKDRLEYQKRKSEAANILDKIRRTKQKQIEEEERKKEEDRLFKKLNLL